MTCAVASLAVAVILCLAGTPERFIINRTIRAMKADMKWELASSLSVSLDVYIRSSDDRMLRMLAKYSRQYHPHDVESAVLAIRSSKSKPRVTVSQLDAIALVNDARGRKMTLEENSQWQAVIRHVVAHPDAAALMVPIIDRGEHELDRIVAGMHVLKSGGAPSLLEGAL